MFSRLFCCLCSTLISTNRASKHWVECKSMSSNTQLFRYQTINHTTTKGEENNGARKYVLTCFSMHVYLKKMGLMNKCLCVTEIMKVAVSLSVFIYMFFSSSFSCFFSLPLSLLICQQGGLKVLQPIFHTCSPIRKYRQMLKVRGLQGIWKKSTFNIIVLKVIITITSMNELIHSINTK